jgi:hypothetical protein
MADQRLDKSELTSINQLIQDIIGGSVRRNTFTQWELELLLDLQTCGVRKSARAELLRRYVKAVQQQFAQGSFSPMRLSEFLEKENQKRTSRPAASLGLANAGSKSEQLATVFSSCTEERRQNVAASTQLVHETEEEPDTVLV